MPIAHACHACGESLTEVHPRWDVVAHLPVVVCPGCGAACVRRRHPLSRAWRSWRSWNRTLGGLGGRLVASGALVLALVGLSAGHGYFLDEHDGPAVLRHVLGLAEETREYEAWLGDNGPALLATWIGLWMMAGLAITAGLRHAPRWKLAAALYGSIGLALAFALVTEWAGRAASVPADGDHSPLALVNLWPYQRTLTQVGLGSVVMLAGVPFGLRMRKALAARESKRSTRARARVIKRRRARAWA